MIVGVAVRFPVRRKQGYFEVRLPRPNRHVDCFRVGLYEHGLSPARLPPDAQGFYTDTGQFLTRQAAMTYVKAIGQSLLPDNGGHVNDSDYLFSEDLW